MSWNCVHFRKSVALNASVLTFLMTHDPPHILHWRHYPPLQTKTRLRATHWCQWRLGRVHRPPASTLRSQFHRNLPPIATLIAIAHISRICVGLNTVVMFNNFINGFYLEDNCRQAGLFWELLKFKQSIIEASNFGTFTRFTILKLLLNKTSSPWAILGKEGTWLTPARVLR